MLERLGLFGFQHLSGISLVSRVQQGDETSVGLDISGQFARIPTEHDPRIACGEERSELRIRSMMKKALVIGVGLVAAVVIGLVAIVSIQPPNYLVQRSIIIDAPPDVVFAHLNDLQAWDAWSPWKELDPNPQTRISSPSAGKGATFFWSGNDQIGEGTLTIVESKPDQLVDVEQEFVRPFAGKANLTFTITIEEEGTQLVWKLHGENDFAGKVMCLFMDMDAMAGPQFEIGLVRIRDIAEGNGGLPIQTIAETPGDKSA